MKIIHCADIHLDSKMESNLTKEQAKERKNEILMTFFDMVDYAEENNVEAIIIAGDLFDSKRVSVTTKNLVYDCIISNPKIDFLYLSGNHDSDNFISEMKEKPSNLKLFSNEWTIYKYDEVSIYGAELSQDNSISLYNTLIPEKSETNIVVLHGQESKYENKDKTEIINIANLKNRYIDYLALGHIHSYKCEKLDNRGVYCYCGCLEGRGFDECGEKGFVLLNARQGKISHEFIKFAKRSLYEIHVDISGKDTTSEVLEAVNHELSGISEDSLVKIILEGRVNIDSERDIAYLLQKLSANFYFVKIYDQTKLAIHIEDYQYDISLKGEFIRLVMGTRLSQKDKEQIIINGIHALSGEEID